MIARAPQYILYAESQPEVAPGHWRFVLRERSDRAVGEASEGPSLLEVADAEPGASGERAELLAVVRGLEALDEPAQVTLVTSSSYVRRGLNYGLQAWRENHWNWESFGRMVPIKHRDLWQRLDRALDFHEVKCRSWRIDAAHPTTVPAPLALPTPNEPVESVEADHAPAGPTAIEPSKSTAAPKGTSRRWRRRKLAAQHWVAERAEACRTGLAQFGTRLLPEPWLG